MLREQDPAKAAEIERWIDQVEQTWNVLPIDGRAFRVWAKLMHRRQEELLPDALIAATAIVHNFILVTRNVHHFTPFEVRILNPFEARPSPA